MNFFRKRQEKRLRKELALHTYITIAELPAVCRWINGDDSASAELTELYKYRARNYSQHC